MSNFKIGEKVVCVHTFTSVSEAEIELGVKAPIKNEIYTIRFICSDGYLMFEEIINPILGYLDGQKVSECSFNYEKFRKLDYAHTERICAEIIESLKVNEPQLN